MNNKTVLTDADLIQQYKDGNDRAFQELLERYKDKVFTTIHLIVKDRYVAEDLLQETFVKLINTIHKGKYNERGKFGSFASRVGHNMAIDYLRKQKKRPTIVMDNQEPLFHNLNSTEENYVAKKIRKENTQFVKELIKTLPHEQREVLVLRHYSDMSFKEIAEATGVSINTALGRMRYAIINLRKELDKRRTYD